MNDLINRVIDPVKMAFCPGTVIGIAAWLFQHAELFLCRNSYCVKIQLFLSSQDIKGLLCHAARNGSGSEIKQLFPIAFSHGL